MSTRRVTWRVRTSRITSSEALPILSCRLTKASRGGRERQTDRKQYPHRETQRYRERQRYIARHQKYRKTQKQRDTETHQTEKDIRDVVRHNENRERHTERVRQRDGELTAFWEQGSRTSMV